MKRIHENIISFSELACGANSWTIRALLTMLNFWYSDLLDKKVEYALVCFAFWDALYFSQARNYQKNYQSYHISRIELGSSLYRKESIKLH